MVGDVVQFSCEQGYSLQVKHQLLLFVDLYEQLKGNETKISPSKEPAMCNSHPTEIKQTANAAFEIISICSFF